MNDNLRKRRAYGLEDHPQRPVLEDLPQPVSAGVFASPPLELGPASLSSLVATAQQQYILDHAASIPVSIIVPLSTVLDPSHPDNHRHLLDAAASNLGIAGPTLEGLRNQHLPPRKRLRLGTRASMSSAYSDEPGPDNDGEKSGLSGPEGLGGERARSLLPGAGLHASGWTRARLANCFASFSMCHPCGPSESPPEFDALPPAKALYADYDPPPNLLHPQNSVFACDNPALGAPHLTGYPPLQPTHAMGLQPSTSREDMVYPTQTPSLGYGPAVEQGLDGSDLAAGMRGWDLSHQLNSPTRMQHNPQVTTPSLDSPSHQSLNPLVNMLPGFMPLPMTVQDHGLNPEIPGLPLHGMLPALDGNMEAQDQKRPAKRGNFKDMKLRQATAVTRKMGSCIRCRLQRIRCQYDTENASAPCLTCKKMATNPKIYRIDCLRWKLIDVKLYKPGQAKGLEWTSRWRDDCGSYDIGTWASPETRMILVTEGYTGKSIPLRVRRFEPQEGDKLNRTWVSEEGVKKSVPIEPYAIFDMEAAKEAFHDYIQKGLIQCCMSILGPHNKLVWQTYWLAIKMMGSPYTDAADRDMLRYTLELWMSIRLTTKSWEIVGDDTLDMPVDLISDGNDPRYHKIPLPPVMGAQIDAVLIHDMQFQLRQKTLDALSKLTQNKKQKTWLSTYLATFILLHNIALITKHDGEYAKKHGLGRRFAREEQVKQYEHGANTLLAYFHYCNKSIYPFSPNCKDRDLHSLVELDDEGMLFVHSTRRHVWEQKKVWQKLWSDKAYEDEYYFISQLYEESWKPRNM